MEFVVVPVAFTATYLIITRDKRAKAGLDKK